MSTLVDPASAHDAALANLTAERFAAEDEARMELLNKLIKAGCRNCGGRINEDNPTGYCTTRPACKKAMRLARRAALAATAFHLAPLEAPPRPVFVSLRANEPPYPIVVESSPVQTSAIPAAPTPTEAPKEAPMPSDVKTCSLCNKTLRSDNAKGRCGDPVACAKRAAKLNGASPAETVAAKPKRPPGEVPEISTGLPDPARLETAELIAWIKAVDEYGSSLRDEARQRRDQLAAACGDAA